MRTIDRFNAQHANRVYRSSKVIYQFAKYGSKGVSKVNPALVFIDTVVSLGELFISYSQYRQAKEQNKQLEIQIETLRTEFSNLKKSLQIDEDKFKIELENSGALIEMRLKNNRLSSEMLRKAYTLAQTHFIMIKTEVEQYKREYPYSKATQKIEEQYYEALTAYTKTSLEFIGG